MGNFLIPFLYVCIGMMACDVINTQTDVNLVYLGSLSSESHNIKGELYARDQSHLILRNFEYDGLAPWAYFVIGSNSQNYSDGHIIRDVYGTFRTNVTFYGNQSLYFSLGKKKVSENSWFIVWCQEVRRVLSRFHFPDPQPQISIFRELVSRGQTA